MRIGNFDGLHSFAKDITSFYMASSNIVPFEEQLASITSSINKREWGGAVLCFDGIQTVGFMNFLQERNRPRIFQVGYTFVEEPYRNKRIWTTMSELVETEVERIGGKRLNREVKIGNEYLMNHLKKEGYQILPSSNELDYRPMAKRL